MVATGPSTDLLVAVNLALGAVCVFLLAAVLTAVWRDLAERRRWRAMIPDGWPPSPPSAGPGRR